MKQFLTSNKKAAGFTLIELLVVIGILGILAAALIATIDPFEQLKKAQDANVKNTAVEFVNANIRYYTTHNTLPWTDINNAAVGACTTLTTAGTPITVAPIPLYGGASNTAATNCLQGLIADGELKTGFTTVTDTLKAIYVSSNEVDATNTVVACFKPQSKSQAKDANCKFNQDGTPNATATHTPGDPNECYWCAE